MKKYAWLVILGITLMSHSLAFAGNYSTKDGKSATSNSCKMCAPSSKKMIKSPTQHAQKPGVVNGAAQSK